MRQGRDSAIDVINDENLRRWLLGVTESNDEDWSLLGEVAAAVGLHDLKRLTSHLKDKGEVFEAAKMTFWMGWIPGSGSFRKYLQAAISLVRQCEQNDEAQQWELRVMLLVLNFSGDAPDAAGLV